MPLLFKRYTILPLLALFILLPECVAAKEPTLHNGIYSAPSDPAEAVAVFYFSPQNTTFWAYYGNNYKTIGEFAKVVEANREDILSGRAVIRINGYSTSMPTARENLKIAKIRTNHVKSWYIITAGLEEKHFKTYNSARPWNGRSEITAVMYLQWIDKESKPAGEEGGRPGDSPKEDGSETEPQTGTGITEGVQTATPTDETVDKSHGNDATEPLGGKKELTPGSPQTGIPPGSDIQPDDNSDYPQTGVAPGEAGVQPGERGSITSTEVSPSGGERQSTGKKPFIAIKTNALLWGGVLPDFKYYTFVPNLGVEWYFADKWSLAASGAYRKGWAGSGKFFGVSAWCLEPRLWLGGDGRFRGLFVGIYALAGDFDNQNINSAHYKTGSYFGGGLSLGGYVPLWRNLGIEASVSGGYLSREIDFYSYMAPNYYRDYTEKKGKFGLTNVNISVVYRFNKSSK